jgi:hypothetical protein
VKYFIDTEFIEDGETIELLSIGVVSEDGHELYLENDLANLGRASEWVKDNVIPHLHGNGMTPWEMAKRLQEFTAGEYPEFWSWCSAYDWVAICQLYGTMMDKPPGWPSYCRDLQQELDREGIKDDELPPHPGDAHDAMADARWHRDIHDWLVARASRR